MGARLEVFFDVSSPWTYLAFDRLVRLAREKAIDIEWKPILVGGVFNAVNQGVYEQRANPNPRKAAYAAKDLADWARFQGLTIGWPSVFPVRSVLAMRACCAALGEGGPAMEALARSLFQAYWGEDRDIGQPEVVAACADSVGLDGAALVAAAQGQPAKDQLAGFTQELVDRGGFGSPTVFVDGADMYFGNDRMELITAALEASR